MLILHTIEGVAANAIGTESARKVTGGTVCSATAEGVLAAAVKVNNVRCTNVVDALNAMRPTKQLLLCLGHWT